MGALIWREISERETEHGIFVVDFFVCISAGDAGVLLRRAEKMAQYRAVCLQLDLLRLGRADLSAFDGAFDHNGVSVRLFDRKASTR